jgi:uncharacterized protein (TIGR02453 family)
VSKSSKSASKGLKSAASNAIASKPAASKAIASKPAASKPAASKAIASKPAASKPAASKPAASKAIASKPAASKPAASKPAASKPAASKPAASKPAASTAKSAEFQGFPRGAIEFLGELEANNHREWFTANKSRYEMNLKRPFEALASDLEPELGSAKVFRIYNDVRFAKGKPPYKTHGSVVFEDRRGLVYYVHLEKDHLFVATGMHSMLPDQVRRFLDAAIDPKHGARLAKTVANAEANGLEIGGEALKTVARGYPKDHPNARFLRHKGLTTSVRYELAPWMHEPVAVDRMRDVFSRSVEVNDWLATHVGRSEDGARWVKH